MAQMQFMVPPWAHQLKAIHESREKKNYALFFEQGTGKTMTLINILRLKYVREQRVMRTLILTPRIVVPNWVREFETHSKIKSKFIHPLQGPGFRRAEKIKKHGFSHGARTDLAPGIFITNYEALNMDDVFEALWDWKPEILVLDESHKCKDFKSKRTKKAIQLGDIVKHCYLLTGTPMPNGLEDIWAQFRILDKGETFGKNFYKWRIRYFYDQNAAMPRDRHFPKWVPHPKMMKMLQGKINKLSARVKKMDCLDLPPLVRQRLDVELGRTQLIAYKEMKRDFITYLNGDACVAQLAITKGLRLQQIISGYMPVESGESEGGSELKRFKTNPRLDALRDLLVDLAPTHKIIVWAVFKENYAMIREVCDAAKIRYVEVHGGVRDSDKDKNVDEFNNNDDVRVFIGHPGSGGIGINLVASDISIFYSRNFSLESDLQAEARNHRGGSERHKKITRIDLVASGTIDEQIMKALESKEKVSESVLRQMAKEL